MNMRRVTHALLALTMTATAAIVLTANDSTANVVGPKKVLVLRVAASDDTTTVANRWSKTDAESIFAKVDDLFQKTSYGKMSLDITVTDQFSLPSPENSYRNGNISSTAQWNKVWTDAVANAPAGLDCSTGTR